MSESENTTLDNTILESVNMTAEEVTEVEAALEDAFGFLWTADASDMVDEGISLAQDTSSQPKVPALPSLTLPKLPSLPSLTLPKLPSLNISGKVDAVKKKMHTISESLSNKMDAARETISKSVTYVKETLSSENLKTQGKKAVQAAKNAVTALNNAIQRSLQAASSCAEKFSNVLLFALSGLRKLMKRMAAFPLKKAMVGVITAGLEKVKGMWKSAMNSVESAVSQVIKVVAQIDIRKQFEAAKTIVHKGMTKLLNHGLWMLQASKKMAEKFATFLVDGLTWMVDGSMIGALKRAITGLAEAVWKGAIAVFNEVVGTVKAVFWHVVKGVTKGVAEAGRQLYKGGKLVLEAIRWTVTKAVEAMKAMAAAIPRAIFAIPNILQSGAKAVQAGAAKVVEMLQSIKNAIPGAIEEAKKTCKDLADAFALLIKNIMAGVKSGVLASIETFERGFKRLRELVGSGLVQAGTALKKVVDAVILYVFMYPFALIVVLLRKVGILPPEQPDSAVTVQ